MDSKKKIIIGLSSASGCTFSLLFFIVFLVAFYLLGLVGEASSGNSGNIASTSGECGFTISDTSLSKREFKSLIQEYANSHSHWQIFADYADDYYDYANAKGVNPELVVTVASKEGDGTETGGANNYWGLDCPNGSKVCGSYSSFMEGAKLLIDSASNYDTLREWFEVGSYSYIGYFWYNPGNWSDGGCIYASYIYPDGIPDRVKKACSGSSCTCLGEEVDGPYYRQWQSTGINPRPECTPTTDEDQAMYSTYLIKDKMGTARKAVFGLDFEEGVSCTAKSSGIVEDYVKWMIKLAEDDSHGYSQNTRLMNPNVDCSSFVYYGLLKGAKFDENDLGGSYPFTTFNMKEILEKIGFKVHKYTGQDDLKRGDILWRAEHTEVYIGDGKNVGAHSDYDGVNGDSSGNEVNVDDNYSGWTSYIRYEGKS